MELLEDCFFWAFLACWLSEEKEGRVQNTLCSVKDTGIYFLQHLWCENIIFLFESLPKLNKYIIYRFKEIKYEDVELF